MKRLIVLACLSLATTGLFAQFSSAAFTSASAIPGNALAIDTLSNHFSVTPGSAVQPGTSTPIASGNVNALTLDFGTVPSARTITNVFQITNVTGSAQTATLTVSSVQQITSAVFASSGSGSATLSAGASTTLTVTTSSTVAGRGSGTLRLGLSGTSWMYRDYPLHIDEAPEVPGAPTAVQRPAGRIDLAWTASATTTNLAGYNLYRSTGSGFTKQNATPLVGLTYSDTTTVDGTAYTYKVRAVTSGTPVLESLDSTTVTATADATPPGQPSAIALANGGGNGGAYVNAANASSVALSITLPAGSLTTDSVHVTVTNGGSVSANTPGSAGAGTVTVSGLNLSGLGDGTLTITVSSTDLAGNVSATRTVTVTKDTVAPGAPTAAYTDNHNSADQIAGSAEANALITATKTSPAPTATYTTTAAAGGAYTLLVAVTDGKPTTPIAVVYTVTATDAAGNTSTAATVSLNDTK